MPSLFCRSSHLMVWLFCNLCCYFNCWIHIWLIALWLWLYLKKRDFYILCVQILCIIILIIITVLLKICSQIICYIKNCYIWHNDTNYIFRYVGGGGWNLLCCAYHIQLMSHNVSSFTCLPIYDPCKRHTVFTQSKSNVKTDNEFWNKALSPLTLPSQFFSVSPLLPIPCRCWVFLLQLATLNDIPYILETNPHPNLIRTSFCRFLIWKKVSSRF